MKKLKKSALAKFIACILMSVSIVAFAVSLFFLISFFTAYGEKMFEPETLKADIRADEIARIAQEKADEAVYSYYRAIVDEDVYTMDLYAKRFSKDNSNFAFFIQPLGSNKQDLPVVMNYSCNNWQYKNISTVDFDTYSDTRRFAFDVGNNTYLREEPLEIRYEYENAPEDVTEVEVPFDEEGMATTQESNYIEKRYYDLSLEHCEFPLEYYGQYHRYDDIALNSSWSGYHDGKYQTRIEDSDIDEKGNYVASNGIHAYLDDNGQWNYLDMDPQFCSQYNNFFKQVEEQYGTWSCLEWYNDTTKSYIVEVTGPLLYQLRVTSYVKSDLTAHDSFYYSFILNYEDFILDYIYVIFGVSAVLTLLLGAFLIASAGHGKKSEELYLSALDKAPLDLLLLAAASIAFLLGIGAFNYYINFWYEALGFIIWFALVIPVFLLTIAARFKTKTIFKNLLCTKIIIFVWNKVIKRLGRLLKKIWTNIVRIVKILWNKLNIYGKYLGLFAAVAFWEILACLMDYLPLALLVIVLEKLMFGAILVIACINLSKLKNAGNEIAAGNMNFELDTKGMLGEFKKHGENLNSIKNGMANAVEESLKSERMKTELITNVSHDIKTPLTSIINYVDLLKKEQLDNEKADEYIEVLDRQTARLKKLIQDLIDASKASTGNIDVTLEKTDVNVVINQALGEFEDKLAARSIKTIIKSDKEEYFVIADGRHLWRVMENLINNIVKYALEGSRVYIDVKEQDEYISVTFKNISKEELNISGDELMERFVRGDSSRNTEGSGLGLSIARSLMELQKGKMKIIVDGDLFKVVLLLIVG